MIVKVLKKDAPCVQCTATMRQLKKRDIPFEVKIMTDEDIEFYSSRGFSALPIVIAGDQTWSGYRPDKIKFLAVEGVNVA